MTSHQKNSNQESVAELENRPLSKFSFSKTGKIIPTKEYMHSYSHFTHQPEPIQTYQRPEGRIRPKFPKNSAV